MTDPYTVHPASSDAPSETGEPFSDELKFAVWVAGLVNLAAVGVMLPLAATPPGSVIFPIGRAIWLLFFTFVGFLPGVPLSIAAVRIETTPHRRLLAAAAMVACLMPLIVGHLTLELLAAVIGFELD